MPEGWDESYPGAGTSVLSKPIVCPKCGKLTPLKTIDGKIAGYWMVAPIDGIKVHDWRCEGCYVEGLPKRRRRGKAMEAVK